MARKKTIEDLLRERLKQITEQAENAPKTEKPGAKKPRTSPTQKSEPKKPEPVVYNLPTRKQNWFFRPWMYVALAVVAAYSSIAVYNYNRHEERQQIIYKPNIHKESTPTITATPQKKIYVNRIEGSKPPETQVPQPPKSDSSKNVRITMYQETKDSRREYEVDLDRTIEIEAFRDGKKAIKTLQDIIKTEQVELDEIGRLLLVLQPSDTKVGIKTNQAIPSQLIPLYDAQGKKYVLKIQGEWGGDLVFNGPLTPNGPKCVAVSSGGGVHTCYGTEIVYFHNGFSSQSIDGSVSIKDINDDGTFEVVQSLDAYYSEGGRYYWNYIWKWDGLEFKCLDANGIKSVYPKFYANEFLQGREALEKCLKNEISVIESKITKGVTEQELGLLKKDQKRINEILSNSGAF